MIHKPKDIRGVLCKWLAFDGLFQFHREVIDHGVVPGVGLFPGYFFKLSQCILHQLFPHPLEGHTCCITVGKLFYYFFILIIIKGLPSSSNTVRP